MLNSTQMILSSSHTDFIALDLPERPACVSSTRSAIEAATNTLKTRLTNKLFAREQMTKQYLINDLPVNRLLNEDVGPVVEAILALIHLCRS